MNKLTENCANFYSKKSIEQKFSYTIGIGPPSDLLIALIIKRQLVSRFVLG